MVRVLLLQESGLSRILRHLLGAKTRKSGYAILTSDKGNLKKGENNARLKELEHHLRSKGHSFVKMTGHGQEEVDGKLVSSKERSLFIRGIGVSAARKLGKKFDQHSIIYGGRRTKGQPVLHILHTGEKIPLGTFHGGKAAQFHSKVHSRPFHFG